VARKSSKKTPLLLKRLAVLIFAFFVASSLYPKINTPVCANTLSCKESLSFKVENNSLGVFENKKIAVPPITNTMLAFLPNVLGDSTAVGEKHIYVDLTNQKLYAYQGDDLFMETYIATGKWHPTPTGEFKVWVKLRSTRMSGGEGDDYYNLPNVPYVMFFYNGEVPKSAGFSLHGAYWHDNFGHAMSHGCVNLKISDAEKLYFWADPPTEGHTTYSDTDNPGTKVTIYGEAP